MFGIKIKRFTLLTFILIVPAMSLNVGAEELPAIDNDLALGRSLNRQRAFRPVPGSGSADLFGGMGGNIHPFISVTALYTDNVFNSPANEESDVLTTSSPGLLLAYPGVKSMPGAAFSTSDLTPGGLVASRVKDGSFQRLQTSLLYQGDFESYSDNTSAGRDHHRAEGLVQFNLKGGVSFDLAGEHKLTTAAISQNAPLDEYQSDLIDFLFGIKLGSKGKLALGYSSFQLAYDKPVSTNDRQDDTMTGHLSFEILNKTSIFGEYQLINVDYDQATFSDNELQKISLGLNWAATAKSSGNFVFGQVSRDHELATLADVDEMFYQLQGSLQFTKKSSLSLTGTRRLGETTVAGTNYILNDQFSINYQQTLSAKFKATINGSYTIDTYDLPITIGTLTGKQEDKIILISPTLDYLMQDWFTVSLSLSISDKDSNFDSFDYTANSLLLRVTGYL